MPSPLALELAAIVMRRADERAGLWFAAQYQQVHPGLRRTAFLETLAETTPRLGRHKVDYSPEERQGLLRANIVVIPPTLRLDEAGAAALWLEGLAGMGATDCVGLVHDVFYRGTMDQRCTLLKFLHHLPDPGRFVDLAMEAVFGSSQDVKKSLILDNPYPVTHLPDSSWAALVGVVAREAIPFDPIYGLPNRLIPPVVKELEQYIGELRRFRKPVPAPISQLLETARSGMENR
ncbi:MAG: hypothetical protein HUU55_08730 [Myxococcales bacterium]|nr:hypothetical protein [Myxococcales bacterium]